MVRVSRSLTWSLMAAALVVLPLAGGVDAHIIKDANGKPKRHWVRYPFEFQLCGIPLGSRVLDREPGNDILRYSLFRVYGNPTAVVVGTGGATAAQTPPGGAQQLGAGGEGEGEGEGEEAGTGGGEEEGAAGEGGEGAGGGGGGAAVVAPPWALAAWVEVDQNHVEWLYRRETYTMGFTVDRLGFVDQIIVAGTECPLAATQNNDPQHRIRLGDDYQRVLYRYGLPDEVRTYVATGGGGGGGGEGGGPGGSQGAEEGGGLEGGGEEEFGGEEEEYGGMEGSGGGGGGAGGAPTGGAPTIGVAGGAASSVVGAVSFAERNNVLLRDVMLFYHDTYNVIFTLRNNRVVRIHIFGDPDHFNEQRILYYRTNF